MLKYVHLANGVDGVPSFSGQHIYNKGTSITLPDPILDLNGDVSNFTEEGTGVSVWNDPINSESFIQTVDGNRPSKLLPRGLTFVKANGDRLIQPNGIESLKYGTGDFATAIVFDTTNSHASGINNAVLFTTGCVIHSAQGFGFVIAGDNKLRFITKKYLGTGEDLKSIASDNVVNSGSLQVVIGQRVEGQLNMWVNGVKQIETVSAGHINVSWSNGKKINTFGTTVDTGSRYFDGNLYDFKAYSSGVTLTDEQVLYLTSILTELNS